MLLLFTKSNTPLEVTFTFLELYKWYQIAQNIYVLCQKITFHYIDYAKITNKDMMAMVFIDNFEQIQHPPSRQ